MSKERLLSSGSLEGVAFFTHEDSNDGNLEAKISEE
jgi:hypothetical protein